MNKKVLRSLRSLVQKVTALPTILRHPHGVPPYRSTDVSQRIRIRLMNAYWHFPRLKKKALAILKEACRTHKMRYDSPKTAAETALGIAFFKLENLADHKGAERYAVNAFDIARQHDLREIIKEIEARFPELLYN